MKILLINFVMDRKSPVLAWQHSVATRLAARCERLVVLTERIGDCELPGNVEVHCVPRILTTPLRMLGARWLMNVPVWIWCGREQFDAAFVHMNADWAYRLAPCWRRFGIPVLLWYAHGTVTNRLRRAHEHAACVVTSTPEGFRIPSAKVRVIGQGIDTDLFTPPASRPDTPAIVAVGRVSRRKSVDLMLEALAWLKTNAPQHRFTLRIIGPTLTRDDRAYAAELAAIVERKGLVGPCDLRRPGDDGRASRYLRVGIPAREPEPDGQHGQNDSGITRVRLPDADEQHVGVSSSRGFSGAHRSDSNA